MLKGRVWINERLVDSRWMVLFLIVVLGRLRLMLMSIRLPLSDRSSTVNDADV